MKGKLKQIVWAVDALESPDYHKNSLFILGALARAVNSEVLPTYILKFPDAWSGKSDTLQEAYYALVEKRMAEVGKSADIPGMINGKIIRTTTSSTRSAVSRLLDYATEQKAAVIVVATHSKGAVPRFLLGSFAETLLLQSKIPILSVNPQTQVREKISNILFPTTFDPKFRPAFERTVDLAKQLDANVTLFYKEPFYPLEEISPELYRFLDQQEKELRQEAEKWGAWAETLHVPVKYHIDFVPGSVSDGIVKYAGEVKADLVALVSQTEGFASPRVGSTVRKVVRESSCPVWVMKTDDLQPDEIT